MVRAGHACCAAGQRRRRALRAEGQLASTREQNGNTQGHASKSITSCRCCRWQNTHASAARQRPAAQRCAHHRLLGRRAVRLLVSRAQQRPAAAQRRLSALHRGRCAACRGAARTARRRGASQAASWRGLRQQPPAGPSCAAARACARVRRRHDMRQRQARWCRAARAAARQFGSSFAFSTGAAGGSALTIRYGAACTSFCRS